ncbi:MAG: NUDIX hydrolase [Deltaproteobacteria bacterium]|nr:NUDIX hydrolase [Deltaproteobacteria bacterium]
MADDEGNPFTKRGTRQVYDNAWIRVREDEILTPAGKPGIYGVVEFKNRAVGVVPYENGEIWLVGQWRYPLGSYSWEIPEGGSPAAEELEATARRELKEETGLVARKLERIVEMHLSNSVSDEYAAVFLATGLTQGAAEPEETERLKIRKVTLDEAYALVSRGAITDSLSVAAILKLVLLRHEGRL